MKPLLSPKQVSELTQVPIDTIYKHRYMRQGLGALAIKVGRHLRWRPEDIEAWLDEQTAKAQEEAVG